MAIAIITLSYYEYVTIMAIKSFSGQASGVIQLQLCHPETVQYDTLTREALLKGRNKYFWPPSTNYFRSVAFYFKDNIYLCYKTSYFDKEVNCTVSFLSVGAPCFDTSVTKGVSMYLFCIPYMILVNFLKNTLSVYTVCQKITNI